MSGLALQSISLKQSYQAISPDDHSHGHVEGIHNLTNEEEEEIRNLENTKVKIEDDSTLKYFNYIIGAFVAYLMSSSVVYWYLEDLSPLDSFYLSMITFTTIGYGDIAPTHDVSKLFTCGFVFINLLLVGQLLDYVVDTVVEQRKQASHDFLENVFDKEEKDDDARRHTSWVSKEYAVLWDALWTAGSTIAATIAVGVLFFSFLVDNHSIVDGIYLSCMSVSTVGYGDIVPQSNWSRAFGCVYAVVGTLLFGSAVSGFVGAVGEYRLLAKNEQALSNSVLDYDTFMKADADGSNSVTKEEFVLFRLAQMGVIPDNLRERAENQFDRMDADGSGDLTMEDIILHQNSHHTPEHQQELISKYHAMRKMKEEEKRLEGLRASASGGAYTGDPVIQGRRGSTGMVSSTDIIKAKEDFTQNPVQAHRSTSSASNKKPFADV